jgi:hypothetical protein
VSRIVRDYLVDEVAVAYDYDASTDWAVATAARPEKPFNAVTIYDEAAQVRARFHSGGVLDDPVVTIEVRSVRPEPGQYQAKRILDAMDALQRYTWAGGSLGYDQDVVVAVAHRVRGIFNLGTDDNGRWLYNMEYSLVIQGVAGGPAMEARRRTRYWLTGYWYDV